MFKLLSFLLISPIAAKATTVYNLKSEYKEQVDLKELKDILTSTRIKANTESHIRRNVLQLIEYAMINLLDENEDLYLNDFKIFGMDGKVDFEVMNLKKFVPTFLNRETSLALKIVANSDSKILKGSFDIVLNIQLDPNSYPAIDFAKMKLSDNNFSYEEVQKKDFFENLLKNIKKQISERIKNTSTNPNWIEEDMYSYNEDYFISLNNAKESIETQNLDKISKDFVNSEVKTSFKVFLYAAPDNNYFINQNSYNVINNGIKDKPIPPDPNPEPTPEPEPKPPVDLGIKNGSLVYIIPSSIIIVVAVIVGIFVLVNIRKK